MSVYEVYNSNNARRRVTDEDLDRAASGEGPLPTELANAANKARRADLARRLRESLTGPDRQQKLAAASALLAVQDAAASELLEARAASEGDEVCRHFFRAISARLKGVDALRRAFEDPSQPEVAGYVVSVYNQVFAFTPEDAAFLGDVLQAYLDLRLPWMKKAGKTMWKNDVSVLVALLSATDRDALAAVEGSAALRARWREQLARIADSSADSSTKRKARQLVDALGTELH